MDGMRNGAALDVRNKTYNGRDQSWCWAECSIQRSSRVGHCQLEGFIGYVGVLDDGVDLAGTQFIATARDANHITESQSDGISQFPILYNSNFKKNINDKI